MGLWSQDKKPAKGMRPMGVHTKADMKRWEKSKGTEDHRKGRDDYDRDDAHRDGPEKVEKRGLFGGKKTQY